MAELSAQYPSISYEMGGRRRNKPTSQVEAMVAQVANDVRPGTRTHLWSGQEDPGVTDVGSRRHEQGFAGDFKFSDTTTGKFIGDVGFMRSVALGMVRQYGANIGYGTGYMGFPEQIHIDVMPRESFTATETAYWKSMARKWAAEPDFIAAYAEFQKANKINLPDQVNVPLTREQALAKEQAVQAAIGSATDPSQLGNLNMADPNFSEAKPLTAGQQYRAAALAEYGQTRALNQQPPSYSPPNPGALRGQPVGALPSQLGGITMANPNFAAPPGMIDAARRERTPSAPSLQIGAAPVGQVTRAPLAGSLRNAPVASNSPPNQGALRNAPVASNSPPNPGALRGSLAPAARPTANVASVHPDFGSSTQTKPGSPAGVAGLLSQDAGAAAMRAKTFATDMGRYGMYAPAITVNHPPNPTVGIPTAVAPAVPATPATAPTVAVPALAPPTVIAPQPPVYQPRPVSQVAPIAMRPTPTATAGDVYAGLANTAMDNTGQNRVSSIPGGTSVTNKYGATTGMVGGYQTAVGSMPSIPGMSMPAKSTIGGAVKGAVVGSSLGPLGALAGAALGAAIAKAAAEKNGTTAAKSGGLLGGLFGGNTASKSGASSGKTGSSASKSSAGGGLYGASGSGSYGTNPNSKSTRY